jgi:hypothetical protein
MTGPCRLAVVAALALSAGCSTVPKTAAIQKTAVGGGFIAVGTVTLSLGAVAAVGGAVAGSSVPSEQAEAFNTTLLIAVGIPVVIGVGELVAGGLLLQRGGEEIDAADRLQTKKDAASSDRVREVTRPRPKAVRTAPETPMWGPSETPQAGDESDDTSPR